MEASRDNRHINLRWKTIPADQSEQPFSAVVSLFSFSACWESNFIQFPKELLIRVTVGKWFERQLSFDLLDRPWHVRSCTPKVRNGEGPWTIRFPWQVSFLKAMLWTIWTPSNLYDAHLKSTTLSLQSSLARRPKSCSNWRQLKSDRFIKFQDLVKMTISLGPTLQRPCTLQKPWSNTFC